MIFLCVLCFFRSQTWSLLPLQTNHWFCVLWGKEGSSDTPNAVGSNHPSLMVLCFCFIGGGQALALESNLAIGERALKGNFKF